MAKYHRYYLFQRDGEAQTFFKSGKLFQQYIVDVWAVTEQNRLRWLRLHQKNLRAELYHQVVDAFAGLDNDVHPARHPDDMGQKVILPATFTGSTRDMMENLQNSLAIARKYGTADVFLTMTANPNWPEVKDALLEGQTPQDRPDLVARVFHLKKEELIRCITKDHILGRTVARVHTIEFQKRGLPHMHLLIWFDQDSKIRAPEDVDSLISATFPDQQTHPRLYKLVCELMTHGPCGSEHPNAPCMQDGKCSKHFPKAFQEETSINEDGYPQYCCPNDGKQHNVRGHMMDNRNVIPFCAMLLLKFECHINVELTFNMCSIKYIHKYVYKGHDRTTMELSENRDEIKKYLDARYISSHEASWRLLEFKIHVQIPAVIPLPVHLPGQHNVTYDANQDAASVLERAEHSKTMLMGYFEANTNYPKARELLYVQFPEKFVWQAKAKAWKPRQHDFAIGRLHFASPASGERFHLHTLLTVVRGVL
jgi:Helitron helicase-like domain at N-terminus